MEEKKPEEKKEAAAAPAAAPAPPAPPAPAAKPAEAKPAEAKPDPKLTMGKGKTILVVDDDPGSVELLKGILEKVEFEVASAKDGQEALTKLGITKPSLMIVDVLMPGMDGFAFFKELKKNKETEGIPVLIHTIRKNMEDSFMAMGANGFLSKPVDTGNLFEMISKLSTRPAAAAPAKDAPPKAEEKKH